MSSRGRNSEIWMAAGNIIASSVKKVISTRKGSKRKSIKTKLWRTSLESIPGAL